MSTETITATTQHDIDRYDGLLLEQALNSSDEAAFNEFFNKHYDRLVYFARRKVSDANIAEDLVQEAFAKVWQAYQGNFEQQGKSGLALLQTVIKNLAISHYRKQQTSPQIFDYDITDCYDQLDLADNSPHPASRMIAAETIRIVLAPLDDDRKHLFCAIIDGEVGSLNEYAEDYGVKRATVGTRLIRGRRQLREHLETTEV